jgi:hypothetical protein
MPLLGYELEACRFVDPRAEGSTPTISRIRSATQQCSRCGSARAERIACIAGSTRCCWFALSGSSSATISARAPSSSGVNAFRPAFVSRAQHAAQVAGVEAQRFGDVGRCYLVALRELAEESHCAWPNVNQLVDFAN